MLDAIRDFFDRRLGSAGATGGDRHSLEVATAALLIEVVRFDGGLQEDERAVVLSAVKERFGLGDDEAAELVALAEAEARQATDHFQFTSLVNQRFDFEQKLRVVELMWEVAYADAVLSAHEVALIRKVADLLYVPHSEFIAAKLRARDARR